MGISSELRELLEEVKVLRKPDRVRVAIAVVEAVIAHDPHEGGEIARSVLEAMREWRKRSSAENREACRNVTGDAEEIFNDYACQGDGSPYWSSICYGGWTVTENHRTNAVHCITSAVDALGERVVMKLVRDALST